MISSNYPINRFANIGYRKFTRADFENKEKFSLNATKTENIALNVDDIISNLENGNKDTIDVLENLGLNYSLTEYQKGYKIKFEHDGKKYTVAYNGETTNTDFEQTKTNVENTETLTGNNATQKEVSDINPPIPPSTTDYLKEVKYSNGIKETLVDEDAYNQVIQDYQNQRAEYDNKIQEHNLQVAEQQKQDAINDMQEEWNNFNKEVTELREKLDTNGTNSKMMNSIIHELSADYAKLIQRKMETKLKNVDLVVKNINNDIPNPPAQSNYETDEEYANAMNIYTYQKFLYEKQQQELELKTKLTERRIEKMDKKLEEIRKLLFNIPT